MPEQPAFDDGVEPVQEDQVENKPPKKRSKKKNKCGRPKREAGSIGRCNKV